MSSPRNILIATLGIGLIGLVGLAWQQQHTLDGLRFELEQTRHEAELLRAKITSAKAKEYEHAEQLAGETSKPMPPEDAPLASPEAPGNNPFPEGARQPAFRELQKNPEIQKLMQIQARGMIEGRYADLFRKLQLPPELLESFKGLLLDKQNALRDTMEVAREKGLTGPANRDQLQALVRSTQAEIDSSIRNTIGDSAYSQYKNYEQTAPQRAVTSTLDQRLSYTQTPLTENQANQLIQTLVSNRTQGAPTGTIGTTKITDQTIAQAKSFLSDPQIQALQQLQAEQQAQAQARQLFLNLRRQARQPAPKP